MDRIIAKIRETKVVIGNKTYKQKLITVPAKAKLKQGDSVELMPVEIYIRRVGIDSPPNRK